MPQFKKPNKLMIPLLGLGILTVADATFELCGGRGIIRLLGELASEPQSGLSDPHNVLDATFQNLYPVISDPNFSINTSFEEKIIQYLRPRVKGVLDHLYEPVESGIEEIGNQVAFIDIHRDMRVVGDLIGYKPRASQLLLLPIPDDDDHYFFIATYHSYKSLTHPDNDLDLLHVGKNSSVLLPNLLIYSEACDLAFGWCRADPTNPPQVRRVSFTKDYKVGDRAQIVPSTSPHGKRYCALEAQILNHNGSYMHLDQDIIGGYSGSPVVKNNAVEGIVVGGFGVERKQPDGDTKAEPCDAIAIKTNHIEEMLRFFVDS